jgi:opacity protein-like surface antigen
LNDLQTAIELNDNRAVYRSKLLLDSDLAARSASLARIYSDLGFQQRALVEGYNSVNTDPTNYSAHRFLADSYSALPKHQIARVSELLLSQLLQPNNITPIQPQLAESNLNLISSGGAASVSFSEFNPLFNRNQVTLLATGLAGDFDTRGGEAVISGIYNKLSFSAGYSSFDSDGWGSNHDQDDDLLNIFAQVELTYKTSIQAEYRNREFDNGDWAQYFFEDNYFPTYRQKDDIDTYRIGIRHQFSPKSILIGNFSSQDSTENARVGFYDPFGFFEPYDVEYIYPFDTDQEAYSGELQHLFRGNKIKTLAGVGYFSIDIDQLSGYEVYYIMTDPWTLLDGPYSLSQEFDIEHTNFYLYSYIDMLRDLNITVGASVDLYEANETTGDQDLDEDQINPKVGITWTPQPNTTLRGAVFRTFKRTFITDQTLEPTQVAGFNQFYDDPNATKAWVYGIGVDQKFSQSIYGGAEFSYRDMDVPYFVDTEGFLEFQETEWDEYNGRAYLYWSPYKMLSLSMEYSYEKLDRNEDFTEGVSEVTTHRVPLGINIFHPNGLSLSLKATYWNQDGVFERINDYFVLTPGDDTFWVVDAALGYRFPKRYGSITVGVTNLFDESFKYFETDYNNSQVIPDQFVYSKVTFAFP